MSFQSAPRRPVVTARTGMTIRMGRDDAPLRAVEMGMERVDRSMRHREHVDPGTGFVDYVEHGRTAGLSVNEHGYTVCSTPTASPNADDRRAPSRSIRGVLVSGRGANTRAVRTADMHDDRLPSIRRRPAPRVSAARSTDTDAPTMRRTADDATIRATILAVTGRAYTGPIDARMRKMALDVIAHRESVARYVNG